ncbi:MAG: tetratricopeptide repeat protein [Deltaproteobacteria bacterium]|nr:tetratricopeptide repeat protein [Deltaproteobacteria bacterium]
MIRLFNCGRPFTAAFALMAVFSLFLSAQTGCSKREKTPEEKAQEEAANLQAALGHFNKGNDLLAAKDYDGAITEYVESVKLNPSNPAAQSNLGFAYLDKFNAAKDKKDPGLIDKSLEHQKKATGLNPDMAAAYYGIAMALERKGDVYGALETWRQFLKLSTGKGGTPSDAQWSDSAKKHIKAIEEFIKKREKEGKKAHPQQKQPPSNHKKQ